MSKLTAFVKKEKAWLVLSLCAFVAIAIYAIMLPSQYRAEVLINVESVGRHRPASFFAFFESESVINEAFDKFDLGNSPLRLTPSKLSKNVSVSSSWRKPNTIRLFVTLGDPDTARDVANFIAERSIKSYEIFLEDESEALSHAVPKGYIGDRADEYLKAYEEAENEVALFQSESGVGLLKWKIEIVKEYLIEIRSKQLDAELELEKKLWRMKKLEALKASGVSSIQAQYSGWLGDIQRDISGRTEDNYLAVEPLIERLGFEVEEAKQLLAEISKNYQTTENELVSLQKEFVKKGAELELLNIRMDTSRMVYDSFVRNLLASASRVLFTRETELHRRRPVFTIVSLAQSAAELNIKRYFLLTGFITIILVLLCARLLVFPTLKKKKSKSSTSP